MILVSDFNIQVKTRHWRFLPKRHYTRDRKLHTWVNHDALCLFCEEHLIGMFVRVELDGGVHSA